MRVSTLWTWGRGYGRHKRECCMVGVWGWVKGMAKMAVLVSSGRVGTGEEKDKMSSNW